MPNMTLTKTPMPEQAPDVRNKNFKEVSLGYTEEMAVEEAGRCLHCKNPKCVEGCPVNIRIPEFIAKVSERDFSALTRSSPPRMLCPPCPAVSARRSLSARASVCAA